MVKLDCIHQPSNKSKSILKMFSMDKNYMCRLHPIGTFKMNSIDNACATWGILRGGNKIIDVCKERNFDYYYLDNKYMSKGYIRVTKNQAQAGKIIKRSDDRWKKLGIELQPWKKGGQNIVVCPPTEAMIAYYKLENWVDNICTELAQHTDRPIIVRNKPTEKCVELDQNGYIVPTKNSKKYKGPFKSFDEELSDAHAIIIFNSNVAVEAIYKGVPSFVSSVSAAAPISHTLSELKYIETPRYEEREPWLHHLAYSQFNNEDFQNGTVYRILEEQ